jgi:hypothetical protein
LPCGFCAIGQNKIVQAAKETSNSLFWPSIEILPSMDQTLKSRQDIWSGLFV